MPKGAGLEACAALHNVVGDLLWSHDGYAAALEQSTLCLQSG